MRAILQRVSSASVEVDGEIIASIEQGILIFLGIEAADDLTDIGWLIGKITNMRIFEDEGGKMNESLLETGGKPLVVSQFTLHASTRKGNRPSFLAAAPPELSEPLYEEFCTKMSETMGGEIPRGIFGADMRVSLVNDGPVTIWIDSRDRR